MEFAKLHASVIIKGITIMTRFGIITFILSFVSWAAHAEGPALWTFSDEDTTIHIFGSIHLMKPGVTWYVDEVKAAFEEADTLIVEVDGTKVDPAKAEQQIAALGLFGQDPEDGSLSDYLSEEEMQKVLGFYQGAPRQQIELFKPWFVNFQLTFLSAAQAGFRPDLGIDAVLTTQANAQGIPIEQLETADFQIGMLSSGTLEEQAELLKLTLEQADELQQMFEDMSAAWLEEDLAGLDKVVLKPAREDAPEFFDSIFLQRNRNWIEPITALLDRPGTYFVVVGTGHLIGEGSVIELLEEKGFELSLD